MIKIKKKKGAEVAVVASSAVNTPTGSRKQRTRPAINIPSVDSQPKKKAKTGTSVATANKEPPTDATSSVSDKIQIGGGAVDCKVLDKALRALCRHVQKLHEQEETPDLLAGSGGPTVSLMFSLQNIPDRQRVIPHLM